MGLARVFYLPPSYAIKEGGWWSLSLLVILDIITCFTGILLQRCLESSPSLHSYPDIKQAAFGPAVGGVLTPALMVICLLWVGVVDGIGFHLGGTPLAFTNLPVTVGLFGFWYGSHSVLPILYSSMNEPNRFPTVLIISFITAGLLFMGVGICGYLMFGEAIKSQFTLNMPAKFVTSKVAAWTVVIAPVTKYALTINPVVFSIEELLPSIHQESLSVSTLVRTVLVNSTLVITLAVPNFGQLQNVSLLAHYNFRT